MSGPVDIGHSIGIAISAAFGAEFEKVGQLSLKGDLLLYRVDGIDAHPPVHAPETDFEERKSRKVVFFLVEDLHSQVHANHEKNPPTITVDLIEESPDVWSAERVTLEFRRRKYEVGYQDLPTYLVTE